MVDGTKRPLVELCSVCDSESHMSLNGEPYCCECLAKAHARFEATRPIFKTWDKRHQNDINPITGICDDEPID